MIARYVLIRYRDSANVARVGSGFIVGGSTVLTANHVADGTGHRVVCDPGEFGVDPAKTVLSGTNDVDVGVLQLAGNPLQLGPLSFARVGRDPMSINDCTAVGFPRWTADEADRQYETKQVEGFIRTADRVRMGQDGGAEAQLLQLTISWRDGDQRVPVPAGLLDGDSANPWGGMSGAAVTAPGPVVIGVVHSHNHARNPDVLTVTPLLALTRLPEAKQRQFCHALGIPDISDLPMATGQEVSMLPDGTAVGPPDQLMVLTSPTSAFSDGIRDIYRQELASLGLRVPPPWSRAALEQLYRDCEQRITLQGADADLLRARDLAKALWLAAAALSVLSRFGGQDIGIRKLQYLYHRHVQSPPECATLDGMLVKAAGVGIRETYEAANGRGQPGDETVTALARFMLGIVSHWKARHEYARIVDLREIKSWLKGHLDLHLSDIEEYLDGIRQRFWALIELETPDLGTKIQGSAAKAMPTAIIIQTVSDAGVVKTRRFGCRPAPKSERDVEELLRNYVKWLPDGEFVVDIFLPRDWFDARVEHWDILDVVGSSESLSKKHDPHLRWVKHRRDGELASRLKARFARIQWMESPEVIPPEVTSDPERLRAWLDERNQPGKQDPPYFIGSSHGARDHDPLADLLLEGYGFITWFNAEVTPPVRQAAADVASACPWPWERKDSLPRRLAAGLRGHEPIIIWSDPDKREDFDIPRTKSSGPRRSGRKLA